jgi:hypothetical protein
VLQANHNLRHRRRRHAVHGEPVAAQGKLRRDRKRSGPAQLKNRCALETFVDCTATT